MGDDFMFQLFGKYRDMALAVKNPCHLNMAACLIKLKRFDEAIAQCSIVCCSTLAMNAFSLQLTIFAVCIVLRKTVKAYLFLHVVKLPVATKLI